MRNRRSNAGYTLIELMIVIVIIGVLSSIILPHFVRAKYQAVYTSCQFNLRSMASALESYHTDFGEYPTDAAWNNKVLFAANAAGPAYLRPEPTCQSNGSAYGYKRSEISTHDYVVFCNGIHNLVISEVQAGYPRYLPSEGLVAARQ